MGTFRVCFCYTRKFNMMDLEPPSDIKEMFNKYIEGGGAYMTQTQLSRFLVEIQGVQPENATAEAKKIVEEVLKRRPHIAKNTKNNSNSFTLDDFFYYLFSVDLNPPFQSHIHQDMKAPLSHYFIYTGHNSYLTGNQLTGDCSARLIIRALQLGVRVIELDLWPTSSKDDIRVFHGRTLTTPVDLLTCLRAIRDYAFEKSEYPVIITLEDHLKPKLQAKAAEMIKETFGDMLYRSESDSIDEFPSPEELKHRILISTKTPKECLEAENASVNASRRRNNSDSEHPSLHKMDELESGHAEQVDANGYSSSDSLEPLVYKSLISIHQKKCKIEEAIKLDLKAIRVSLSEQKLEKSVKPLGKDLVRFTQKNILRIYPKGTRFNSSNYKPFLAWMHGAQMVAFNMQGYGRFLWQMQGMFRANGGCGYVKKPEFLINSDQSFDPRSKLPLKTTLKVKIYLGDGWRVDFKKDHFDKFSPPDFYTRIGIAGVIGDEVMHVTTVKEDQWTPIWNQEFEFPLTVPEMALLRIEVYEHDSDKKDDFGGQTCLPISELISGIHAIPLFNVKGDLYKSVKLLMRFGFT
ncbi:phosphoinositide phospholipase C 4-like [Silene latifolia]|uniref:phosphoinositide phospholipase C 4-like n=1 Tax=Silene latifolia TaxID=37657 RepID=UPI003D76E4C9